MVMPVTAVPKLERFFRLAAGLKVNRIDLKRFGDFLADKLYDLLLAAQATAQPTAATSSNPTVSRFTKGLQENIHRYPTSECHMSRTSLPATSASLVEDSRPRCWTGNQRLRLSVEACT